MKSRNAIKREARTHEAELRAVAVAASGGKRTPKIRRSWRMTNMLSDRRVRQRGDLW